MCGIARGEALAVDVDSSVVGCTTLAESVQEFPFTFLKSRAASMRLGDLRDPSLPARLAKFPEVVRAAGIFSNKRKKYSSYGRCGDCRHLGDCMVCPVSIGHAPGNTDIHRVPDLPCAFQLVTRKHRARFPAQAGHLELLTGRAPIPELVGELMRFAAAE
jgi:hypothetical protein